MAPYDNNNALLTGFTRQKFADFLTEVQNLRRTFSAETGFDRRDRGVTPANSVFGGDNFTPTGQAALPAFTPFGTD